MIVDIGAPSVQVRGNTTEEQIARAKKIYSGGAVQQVVTIFHKYDVNETGSIPMSELPRMCHDLGIKPWKAMKELESNEAGDIDLREFISWWFSPKSEHSRQEETHVHNIFNKYDSNKDGKLDQSELVKMCTDLNVKPWKMFKELEFQEDGQIDKRQFTRWWFASNAESAPTVSTSNSPLKMRSPTSPRAIIGKKAVMHSPTKKASAVAAAMADVKRAMAGLEVALAMQE